MNTTKRTELRTVTQPDSWTGYSESLHATVTIPNTILCDACDKEATVEHGYVNSETFLSRYCQKHAVNAFADKVMD